MSVERDRAYRRQIKGLKTIYISHQTSQIISFNWAAKSSFFLYVCFFRLIHCGSGLMGCINRCKSIADHFDLISNFQSGSHVQESENNVYMRSVCAILRTQGSFSYSVIQQQITVFARVAQWIPCWTSIRATRVRFSLATIFFCRSFFVIYLTLCYSDSLMWI